MGYYTNFTLSYDGDVSSSKMDDFIEECKQKGVAVPEFDYESKTDLQKVLESQTFCDYSPLINFVDDNADECKWYEWENDMKRLSGDFPDILFTLEGEGEDSGDVWKAYFLGGKSQVCKAKLTFDEFDRSKLK